MTTYQHSVAILLISLLLSGSDLISFKIVGGILSVIALRLARRSGINDGSEYDEENNE